MFRTQKRRNPATGKEHLWLTRATLQVNYFYFYCVDDDFGPFFIKFCSYFPYGAKLCINGNHWAQRQAEKAGIGFTPMDNAFTAVDDVRRCRRSAIPWASSTSGRCWISGRGSSRTRSPRTTSPRATATTSPSCRPSSASPRCSTSRSPAGSSWSR